MVDFTGNSVPYTSRIPLRILLICWLLSMVVVINAYFGVLTSLSTIPKLEPTVDTLDQLATNRKLRVTAEKGGLLANSLLVCIYLYFAMDNELKELCYL